MEFETLKGKTITAIEGAIPGSELIEIFTSDSGKHWMQHQQDCCESVSVEDIVGNVEDLIGSPVLLAEEVSEEDPNASESGTWTFYKLATIKGSVTIRWYGSSNGWYGEEVSFYSAAIRESKESK